jgi:transcriptional regulator with XRE-family HTH domain
MMRKEIGARIRKERKAHGLTLNRFAKLLGTSTAMLQRIETGAKSPSIELLLEISAICRKSLDEFIQTERLGFYKTNRANRKTIRKKGYEIALLFPFGLISRDISVNYFKGKAGSLVRPHQIKGYDWIYIIAGSCVFIHDGVSHELSQGDAIYYNSQKPHSLRMLTDLESVRISTRM